MNDHWEICSCLLLESKFLHIDKAQLGCAALNTSDWARHDDIAHPIFASVAFCLPILWYCLFLLLVFFFPPPLNQWIFFCLTRICYLLLLPSATSASPHPLCPLKLCDLLYKSSHPPALICHFWTLFHIILFTSSMKWVLLGERHNSFTECAQVSWDYLIKKKLQFLIGNVFRC